MKIKCTRTGRYAYSDPSKKQVFIVENETYDLDDEIGGRVIELDGGDLVDQEPEDQEPEDQEPEVVETIEEPPSNHKQNKKQGKRQPGQRR